MGEPEEAPGSSSGSVSQIGCFACRLAQGFQGGAGARDTLDMLLNRR